MYAMNRNKTCLKKLSWAPMCSFIHFIFHQRLIWTICFSFLALNWWNLRPYCQGSFDSWLHLIIQRALFFSLFFCLTFFICDCFIKQLYSLVFCLRHWSVLCVSGTSGSYFTSYFLYISWLEWSVVFIDHCTHFYLLCSCFLFCFMLLGNTFILPTAFGSFSFFF